MIQLENEEKILLLKIVRSVIEKILSNKLEMSFNYPKKFETKCDVFLLLKEREKIIASIGFLENSKSLLENLKNCAQIMSKKRKTKFPLTSDILKKLSIEISLIKNLKEIQSQNEIIIGQNGLYVKAEKKTGIILPQYINKHTSINNIFDSLLQKSNITKDDFPNLKIFSFEIESFSESGTFQKTL